MTEHISMIELFSGIGAQERALRQLQIPYEVKHTCDCDANAVLSYATMRWDLEKEMDGFEFPSQDKMIEELQAKNLGYDFQKGKHSITNRTPITKLKQYYLADKLSNNLGDISKVERLPYADFVTYSYPCTDLSVAGKGEGMTNKCDKCNYTWPINFEDPKVNNVCPNCGNIDIKSTRSGLLGQVQRLLTVSYDEGTLPKYLLLENVKNLIGKRFKPQFDAWINWLDLIGYNTYYKVLNAKHYGVPQNRERVFAISIRKDVDANGFTFPEQISLTTRLKDVLEKSVDEKYYLPDDRIEKILNSTFIQEKKRIQTTDVCDTLLARDWKDPKCVPVEEDINPVRIGNIYDEKFGTGYAGNVWDKDGISPTLQTAQGGNRQPLIIEEEPFIVASRGRNPENPSDRTTGAHTEQRLEPNMSGCTNTLTSVQKDNYVCEPQVVIGSMQANSYIGDCSISPSLTAAMGMGGGQIPMVGYVEPIVYDDYNSRISSDQDAINTLTCNCGASAERNGVKIIEPIIIEDQFPGSRDARIYPNYSPTLRSNCSGLEVASGTVETDATPQLDFVGGIGDKDWVKDGKHLSRNYPQGSRVYSADGLASALTAQGVGGVGGYSGLYAVEEKIKWRIRKLTSKECWRLMGFTDKDHDRAAQYTSPSARYKQAGNSIVTSVLVALMSSLFIEDGHKADVWIKYLLNYND